MKAKLSKNESLFLDTSVQADKFLGYDEKRNFINKNLKGKTLMSSTWVLGEFKAAFIDDAVTLQALLLDSPTIAEGLLRTEKYRDRIHKRMIKLFGNLCTDGEFDKEAILSRLDILIEYMLEARFNMGLSQPLINHTNCHKARVYAKRVDQSWDFHVRCRKSDKPKCEVEQFVRKHTQLLKDFVESPLVKGSTDNEIKKYQTTIEKILSGDIPRGNNCRALGDVIITLEAPKRTSVFTMNIEHFKITCSVFKKKLFVGES